MKKRLLRNFIRLAIYSSAFAGLFSKPFFESYAVSQETQNAIDEAEAGDVIVLAGKGHEPYQEINGTKYPFDERIIVKEILKEN